jgi:hypothetical protein
VAIAYSKTDGATMKVAVYGLEDGGLSDYAWFEVNFKKQKKRVESAGPLTLQRQFRQGTVAVWVQRLCDESAWRLAHGRLGKD